MAASAFDICENAAADLDRLWDSDPRAAAAVVVALDEVLADPALIEKLTTQGDVEFKTQRLGIKKWREAQRSPNNLWRFRILNTPATSYRIVYGFHWQFRHVCVLAIAHKDKLNYDNLDEDLSERILSDWFEITGGQDT
jgi:mRNA-degrading endonuclease RelE of RelBE toxin-antitoxin system